MSKIGEKLVQIPSSVTVDIKDDVVHVKGQNGEMIVHIPAKITVEKIDDAVAVKRQVEQKEVKAMHGLIRCLIQNAVTGVETLWKKKLKVVGTGYKAKMQEEDLVLELGYSHPIVFKKVENITFTVQGHSMTVSGVDKQLVGEVANKIRRAKRIDPYKGKGVRYDGEIIKLKPGKKAKTA